VGKTPHLAAKNWRRVGYCGRRNEGLEAEGPAEKELGAFRLIAWS
jgi:hypothetical protein